MANPVIAKCPVCSYPIKAEYEGQTTVCAYCGEKLEAVAQAVTIPTPVFVGVIAFIAGMFLGPSIIASTTEGKRWLEQQARGVIGK